MLGCQIWIDGNLYSELPTAKQGLLLLFGTKNEDTESSADFLAEKVVNLRIFEDEQQKMNRSALEVRAGIMIVSQFTLYADTRKGRRPAFTDAMAPAAAEKIYNTFISKITQSGLTVKTGQFGAKMDVNLTNHGPVTVLLEHPF